MISREIHNLTSYLILPLLMRSLIRHYTIGYQEIKHVVLQKVLKFARFFWLFCTAEKEIANANCKDIIRAFTWTQPIHVMWISAACLVFIFSTMESKYLKICKYYNSAILKDFIFFTHWNSQIQNLVKSLRH